MNNQIPYFLNNPNAMINNPLPNNNHNLELEKIINKINRLEKNIRILENRLNKLEVYNDNFNQKDDPKDMYIV